MILGFSTQLNGKPTHFVEKIWKGLKENLSKELHAKHEAEMTHEEMTKPYQVDSDVYPVVQAKLHTIRDDIKDRWKQGSKIDFFINVRKKDMLRFAPVLPVVSTQKIEIIHTEFLNDAIIKVDGKMLNDEQKQQLAWNDGFVDLLHFFLYFNNDFSGKIIHWTDLKY